MWHWCLNALKSLPANVPSHYGHTTPQNASQAACQILLSRPEDGKSRTVGHQTTGQSGGTNGAALDAHEVRGTGGPAEFRAEKAFVVIALRRRFRDFRLDQLHSHKFPTKLESALEGQFDRRFNRQESAINILNLTVLARVDPFCAVFLPRSGFVLKMGISEHNLAAK